MTALLLIDIQNDFLPGGALAVPEAHRIIPFVNRIQAHYPLVVATQDWHPKGHGSFASEHPGSKPFEMGQLGGLPQKLWPDHCIQGSWGADFPTDLNTQKLAAIFRKGMDVEVDSYSAFFDNHHKNDTGLAAYLKGRGVTDLHLVGLAADICVFYSAIDAVAAGFTVTILCDGVAALQSAEFDQQKAAAAANRILYR